MKRAPIIFSILFSIAILMVLTAAVRAQDNPNHVIKLVNGFPPGGNVDVLARVMADQMAKDLGQPIVVENRPGAVGSLAAEDVAVPPPTAIRCCSFPAHTPSRPPSTNGSSTVVEFRLDLHRDFYPFVLCVRPN